MDLHGFGRRIGISHIIAVFTLGRHFRQRTLTSMRVSRDGISGQGVLYQHVLICGVPIDLLDDRIEGCSQLRLIRAVEERALRIDGIGELAHLFVRLGTRAHRIQSGTGAIVGNIHRGIEIPVTGIPTPLTRSVDIIFLVIGTFRIAIKPT